MQQSEPIKPQGAYISDHTVLVDFGNTLQYIGSSILKLREAVDGYFKAVEDAMQEKIDEVRQQLNEAQQVLSEAQSELSSCYSSQTYDEESGTYRPSCSSEERAVRRAEKEVDRIQKILDRLERIKSEVDREFSEYRKLKSFTCPGGGDGVLEWLGETHTKNAISRMDDIMEVVKKYLKTSVSKNASFVPDSVAFATPDNKTLEKTKTDKLRAATEKVREKMKEEATGDRKLNEATAIPLCSRCGRPTPIACICPRPPMERDHIYNNDMSR